MEEKFEQLKISVVKNLAAVTAIAELEQWENKILGRKNGELTELMKTLKTLPEAERKTVGQTANEVKSAIEKAFQTKRQELATANRAGQIEQERLDITQPALPKKEFGRLHPITVIQKDLEDLFTSMGFMALDGPELESDYYNFTALNIPETHPARDMQDTFYITGHANWLMRTHTSPMQVRAMEKYGAPLRLVVPGKCYRNEATDPRHEHTLYHVEGLVVDRDINFSHLKGVLETVARHLYGPETVLRLLPKFYPFVEPGVRGEVTCFLCEGRGCRVCKRSGWLEIFGAGLVHPSVLKQGGVDPAVYQGFAFGLGLSRLAMLKYGIDDVRWLESGNLRFLEQF